MSNFSALLRRADTLRRHESNPLTQAWWAGYLRGLRRAYHRNFGTDEEHAVWLGLANSDDPTQAAQGRGCAAGHTLEPRDPDCVSEKARSEEKSRPEDMISDSGPLRRFGVSKTAGRVPGTRSK